jgi:D-cysteine desulfhydrase
MEAVLETFARVPILSGPTPIEQHSEDLWLKREDHNAPLIGGQAVRALEWVLGISREQGGDLLCLGRMGTSELAATAVHARAAGVRLNVLPLPGPDSPLARDYTRIVHAHAEKIWLGSTGMAGLKAWASVRFLGGVPPTTVLPGGGLYGALGAVQQGLELASQLEAGAMPLPEQVLVPSSTGLTAAGLCVGLRLGGQELPIVALDTKGILRPWMLQALSRRILLLLRRRGAPSVPLRGLELRPVGQAPLPAALAALTEELPTRLALAEAAKPGGLRLLIFGPNGQPLQPLLSGALRELPPSLAALLSAEPAPPRSPPK